MALSTKSDIFERGKDMARALNKVTAGDYRKKSVSITVTGKPKIGKLRLNSETVQSYELITDEHSKSAASGIGRGLVGGTLLGPVGMLAGVMSAKNKGGYHVAIKFRNGKQSLLEVDDMIYKGIITNCFGIPTTISMEPREAQANVVPQSSEAPEQEVPAPPPYTPPKKKPFFERPWAWVVAVSAFISSIIALTQLQITLAVVCLSLSALLVFLAAVRKRIPEDKKAATTNGKLARVSIVAGSIVIIFVAAIIVNGAFAGQREERRIANAAAAAEREAQRDWEQTSAGMLYVSIEELTVEQAEEMAEFIQSLGLGDFISVQDTFARRDDAETHRLEIHDARTRAFRDPVVVLVDRNTLKVIDVSYQMQDIYYDGEIVASLEDFIIQQQERAELAAASQVPQQERDELAVASQMIIREVANFPNTVRFTATSRWSFERGDDGNVTIGGRFSAENAFGMRSYNDFRFVWDRHGDPISLNIDGQTIRF